MRVPRAFSVSLQIEAGEADAEQSDSATLDFGELQECIARCAVNMYESLMTTYLPSHNKKPMTMADAVRSWLANLFFEKSPELCMWEMTVIKAERYDAAKQTKMLSGYSNAQHKLWCQCWESVALIDIHHFPLWEKGVHDVLQVHFPVLMRIFSHYTKGISGMDSATDALELGLDEFHDFVKEAKLETCAHGAQPHLPYPAYTTDQDAPHAPTLIWQAPGQLHDVDECVCESKCFKLK